jgi:hypothetical protein
MLSNRVPDVHGGSYTLQHLSHDLNPCDYLLWAYPKKHRVLTVGSYTTSDLKEAIQK